jgi:choline dehydrogenase-like flavoprotein
MTTADVCIVGAGAAGLTLAHGLRGSGLSVLVLESGPGGGDLNDGEVVGLPYNGLTRGRVRGLGGTTAVWPGQCMRLRDDELARWPLPAGSLDRWYDAAETMLGLTPGETTRDPWELLGEPDPGFDPARIVPTLGVFAHGRRRLAELDTGTATIRTGVTVTRVERGRVETDGGEISAGTVVLCAGALEATRLLLASGVRHPSLGRFFQDHAGCFPARVVAPKARPLQDRYDLRLRGDRRYQPKLSSAATFPGCLANIVFQYGESSPLNAALRLRRNRRIDRDLLRVVAGAPQLAAAGLRVARGRVPAPPPDAIRVLTVVEQLPRAESTLSLSDETDALGMPRLRVDWRLGTEEGDALAAFVAALDEELRRTNQGALEPEPWVGAPDWQTHAFDVFHPAGTTRMGDVVDADCRLADGVYVCGSSVFPSSGCANPTLTILALALRLAGHLRS